MRKTATVMKSGGGFQEVSIATARKAIWAYCLDCSAGVRPEVRECPVRSCPLWPWRLRNHPFGGKKLTQEQRDAASQRLAAARMPRKAKIPVAL